MERLTTVEAALVSRLALDAAGAEAVSELEAAGVATILLKGPAIADRLYDDPLARPYHDVDLLVAPDSLPRAQTVLGRLGYADMLIGARSEERVRHATVFRRDGPLPAFIDLHHELAWCPVDGPVLWQALSGRTRPGTVGGRAVTVLDDAALALIVAGHAVQHGFLRRPRTDLQHAAERIAVEQWCTAKALAERLGAATVLAEALATVAPRLRSEIGLNAEAALSREERMELTRPSLLWPIERFAAAGSLPRAVRGAVRDTVPSPSYMRLWAEWESTTSGRPVPLGGRGRTGILAAYATRLVRRGSQLPQAMREWRAQPGATRRALSRGQRRSSSG